MQSLFWAAAIYGGISMWLAYIKKKENLQTYKAEFCIAGYLLSRAFVWIQLKHLGVMELGAWVLDVGIFVLCAFLAKQCRRGFSWEYVWLYVINPVVLLSLSSLKKMTAAAGILLVVSVMMRIEEKAHLKKHTLELYRYYIGFTICGMLYLGARLLLGQSGSQCVSGDETYPMIWILAVALTGGMTASFLNQMRCWKQECVSEEQNQILKMPENQKEAAGEPQIIENVGRDKKQRTLQHKHFTGKDIVFLVLLTAVYAGIVFFRLGNMEAPQSYIRLHDASQDDRQMIFRFGEDTHLSEIKIFLGVKSKRSISFSYYDFETDRWELFDSKRNIPSVFTWNTVPVDRTIRTMAMVAMDNEAYIHEIVFLNRNGKRVLPVNWRDYEAVFDEQHLYPKYTTYYEGTMFDEVYHARTAYEFVHGLPVYEITHPPLGKLLISLGIRIFGMTPFGWRVVCGIFGTAMLPFLYLFARKISGQRTFAVFAALLFCFEFMHLTLSRIATLDIIVAFFVLGMFYFMYLSIVQLRADGLSLRSIIYLILCGGFSACAVSAKWTGFYAMAGIAVLFLGYVIVEYASSWDCLMQNKGFLLRLCGVCVCAFIILPAMVYFASYIPYMRCGNSDNFIKIAIDNSRQMLRYHKNTIFEHPYSSEWYEWLWNKRPLLDARQGVDNGKVSSVASFGNPVIWWGGLASLLHNIYLWRCRQEKTAAYLCIAYLSMLLPWLFIYRTVFIYQYFICSNILVLLLANSFYRMERNQKQAMIGFGLAAGIMFAVFFPVLTGYPVSADYINQGLEWLRSWGLA